MNRVMKVKKTENFEIVFLFVALAIAVCAVAAVVFPFNGSEKKTGDNEMVATQGFESNWVNQYGLSLDITRIFQRAQELSVNEPLNLTKAVPENCAGTAMIFRTNNLVVNVYLDGKCISFMNNDGNYYNMSSFQDYRLIRFSADDAGKEIRLEIYSTPFSFNCCIDNVYFGDAATLISKSFSDNIFIFVISCLLFVGGIIFLIVGIRALKIMEHSKGMIFFGLFSVFLSLWIINGSVWAYFFSSNIRVIDAGFWLYLITAILFGLLYIYDTFKIIHVLVYRTLLCLWCFLLVMIAVMMLTGTIWPGELVFIQHVFIIFAAVVVLAEMISYLVYNHGNKEKGKFFNLGVITFVIFGLYDICRFYQGNAGDFSAATRIGVIILTATVTASNIGEAVSLVKLGIEAGKIGKIAYTDANTGLGNPAAFKAKMNSLEMTKINYSYIGIIQFDVNNLKIINDTKGHEVGDLLIKTAANIINKSFGTIGTCYRVGGDEFVAITTYNHAPMACQEAIQKFEDMIDTFNRNPAKPFDLRIAYGVAYYQNTENRYISLKDVHKVADERMYNKKKELKARYAKTPEEAVIR